MSKKSMMLGALIGALALAGTAFAADKAGAEAAIAAAKAAQQEANAVGGEWRDTGKIIKQAEDAIAAGNFGSAIELANKAEAQGKLGKEQALGQTGTGNPKYLYN
ncbi:MAG: SoxXA-binding protein [Chromatiaceae bacterium]|nr:SoxXA-binding protein [Gammaproteobacteria bacterium]MCP5304814.1 SoxXA-binding protein [Chromatiaceae bacterium]MCP5314773.1 SoxXA-binding protein [Chromatiaceae bacterium]